ncbi:choline dehydrogenase-like protein [Boeremia exigua]|uniref:choline dehydrogenase-like protein n=1 Tax=Boeremia exigua TaxID=749465 RepID=UPI001E8D3ECB|nr:choline dehydrogenase-like protein [Boeremia exigua]KAH6643611.1 choline dehydrogenase-like protein [Boeremia exigua]
MAVFSRLAVAVQLLSVFVIPALGAPTQQYDYVIVGGGITGLIVANRLSEDKSRSVLVIEAGNNVDTDATKIPYKANDLTAANGLMWDGINSSAEPGLGNNSYPVIVAKVLGGGSVINGMVYDRGSAADYDAWEALGNPGWGWRGLEPYFKKGTTYQPATPDVVKDFNITWDPSTYGKGPLKVSVTSNQYADLKDYWKAWKATGVHVPKDGNNGESYGPSWYPNTMDATTGRRAHARYAYYDPIQARTNLKILTGATAQKIIFDSKDKPTAKGIEFVDATGKVSTVTATKEVILAAGSIQTPKLLQLSGVGPEGILKAAGIKVRVELDAVGSNFQDHPWATVMFNTTTTTFPNPNSLNTNATFNASAWAEYETKKTGPYTNARGNALAFISLPDMTSSDNVNSIVKSIGGQQDEQYLPALYKNNKKLLRGFAAQRKVITDIFKRRDAAVAEFPVPADASFGLVGVEKPLSRGTVSINPANPNGPALVLHNAFVNPVDRTILGISTRYYRTVLASPILSRFKISETVPGAQYKTDTEIYDALLAQGALSPTLAHPSGSCPMMPESAGGCVNEKLLVYGTRRLSVIDASIIPIIPSCHLQATMYGIGEKAADIIKSRQ